ncbi:hypothetical protein N9112_00125 [bacterium]|nr:hypothetical protein [bacterium]
MAYKRPFSMEYVIGVTARYMRRDIEMSIEKTLNRMPEYANDPEKSQEIFKTLSVLQSIKNQINEIESNSSKIKGN